jgi:hypothetical protein
VYRAELVELQSDSLKLAEHLSGYAKGVMAAKRGLNGSVPFYPGKGTPTAANPNAGSSKLTNASRRK